MKTPAIALIGLDHSALIIAADNLAWIVATNPKDCERATLIVVNHDDTKVEESKPHDRTLIVCFKEPVSIAGIPIMPTEIMGGPTSFRKVALHFREMQLDHVEELS